MEIYTDGGCIENPGGIGAWAFVAVADGQVLHKASGGELETTNNRMELTAVIEALKWARDVCTIYTDSDLTVKCGNRTWKRRANLDLWREFDSVKPVGARLKWIKGHSGNVHNDAADEMCTSVMHQMLGRREVIAMVPTSLEYRESV